MQRFNRIVVASALACATGASVAADAPEVAALKQQMQAVLQQLAAMQQKIDSLSAVPPTVPTTAATATAAAVAQPITRKAADGLTLLTRGGELSLYGNLDVSIDITTKGIATLGVGGVPPPGNNGYLPAISTNLSYFGLRGFQQVGDSNTRFVYQLETQVDISATSGNSASNSNSSAVVKGGLTSRNSFIGLASTDWGAIKIGKTDAPYKTSTALLNPFSGMLGDYSVVMGNSGGDNRVEFGTRLDHAIWYESPDMKGLSFNLLIAPGQNRATDNSNLAAGESDCAGGNIPGSGGTPQACNDGAYGSAYSASLIYRMGGLYLSGAYEMHRGVNRTSDLAAFDPTDIANERATKIAVQYRFATGTSVGAAYERLRRDVPAALAAQNERSRNGSWLTVSQAITDRDSVHFGWAHAGRTPGDPGTHNTPGGAGSDNVANMYTLAFKHQMDRQLSWYANFAETLNHVAAHYDLGAGGRGVTTDCHDASNPDASGFDPNGGAPHCYAGGKLRGISVGMKYQF